jgi:phospholipase/carboxylesterase
MLRENGMNRFFKRLSEGVFDEVDLIHRTKQLKEFISSCAIEYGFDPRKLVAIGYSNGANIAASVLFHYSDVFSKAILFHPMVPIRILPPNLENISVFISAGKNDPICPPEESVELEKRLRDANAKVALHWESSGHRLVESEVNAAKTWLQENA